MFRLWAFGDCHVGTDKRNGRDSLSEVLRHSEFGDGESAPAFDWDIAVEVGDMSGGQSVPEDSEGEEIVRQFRALEKHRREDIYDVCGNHDRSGLGEPPAWWWRKWIDPMGAHTEFSGVDSGQRPYPVKGTWERYSFRVGNILFLMMGDINEPTQTVGRGDLGGNPAGVVSGETFAWWKNTVEANSDSIIISVHHYMLKDTTVASGEWEGMRKDAEGNWKGYYHGYKPEGAPKGSSYLYFVDSLPDAQAFENYLAEHPGAIDLWIGGHTHTHPDDTYGNKSHVEKKWGTWFVNAAAVTRYHTGPAPKNPPMSRVFSFDGDSSEVMVQCYMHTDDFASRGWYASAERVLELTRGFCP